MNKPSEVDKMAKKAASSKAKPVKKTAAKPAAKKHVKKEAKKEAKKEVKKTAIKASDIKKVEKKSALSAKKLKDDVKKVAVKEKPQPALMTKKGKTIVDEVESLNEVENNVSTTDAKAEKVSKFKPIRVERGNAADEKAKWAEVFRKYGKEKSVTYKMSDTFAAMTPIQHKVLGWGFVLTNDNDRLEVLFETGIRMLISNYKSS